MSDFSSDRVVGLDIARSLAAIAVILAHVRFLVDRPAAFEFLGLSGKIGVELFFVLSGFLIGAILIKACERELSVRMLLRFWTRRWLRTLPAYFAVLVFIWMAFGEINPLYFLFLQDLVLNSWDILPVSWSLVIEEWFYLLFAPLCVILIACIPRWGFLIASIILLVLPIMLQFADYDACATAENTQKCFESDIRKHTFRFTSLGMGTLLAWLHHQRNLATWLRPHLSILGAVTVLTTAGMFAVCNNILFHGSSWMPLEIGYFIFFPLMGLASLLVITFLFVWEPELPKPAGAVVGYISLTSYSVYLWHLIINEQIRHYFGDWNQYMAIFVFVAGSLVVAGVSYYLVEKPFMKLRERLAG